MTLGNLAEKPDGTPDSREAKHLTELSKRHVLEAVKFVVAFGFGPDYNDEFRTKIHEFARELQEFGITYEEVLEAIQQVHDDEDSGLLTDDPTRHEVMKLFVNVIPLHQYGDDCGPAEEASIRVCDADEAGVNRKED